MTPISPRPAAARISGQPAAREARLGDLREFPGEEVIVIAISLRAPGAAQVGVPAPCFGTRRAAAACPAALRGRQHIRARADAGSANATCWRASRPRGRRPGSMPAGG
jgi:hypothetical protein